MIEPPHAARQPANPWAEKGNGSMYRWDDPGNMLDYGPFSVNSSVPR